MREDKACNECYESEVTVEQHERKYHIMPCPFEQCQNPSPSTTRHDFHGR